MICRHCGKDSSLKISDPVEYRRRKVANARASLAKMRANGKNGGRPKVRDDARIKELRNKGLSIREIAQACGVSTTAVQRGLK